ncbi:ryncolin-1-like [Watersipora subatra]|uniref:ryncolin-1-like n=1 Tax=Watersipora subatra TaxID=2589382 RepID=UPI00355BE4A5
MAAILLLAVLTLLVSAAQSDVIEALKHPNDDVTTLNSELAKTALNNLLLVLRSCRCDASNSHSVMISSYTKPESTTMSAASKQSNTSKVPVSKDCQEHYERGAITPGVYLINPITSKLKPFEVWCDFFDGHGWTVFQKRFDGSVDFYQDWLHYKEGFGTIPGEYWLGLDKIHALTQTNRRLNIFLKEGKGARQSGTWSSFIIGSESENYKLNVSSVAFTGSLEEYSLSYHNGMSFTTKDREHDELSGGNCAVLYHGGWWYNNCLGSNLNGCYNCTSFSGIYWDNADNVKETKMRISRD